MFGSAKTVSTDIQEAGSPSLPSLLFYKEFVFASFFPFFLSSPSAKAGNWRACDDLQGVTTQSLTHIPICFSAHEQRNIPPYLLQRFTMQRFLPSEAHACCHSLVPLASRPPPMGRLANPNPMGAHTASRPRQKGRWMKHCGCRLLWTSKTSSPSGNGESLHLSLAKDCANKVGACLAFLPISVAARMDAFQKVVEAQTSTLHFQLFPTSPTASFSLFGS